MLNDENDSEGTSTGAGMLHAAPLRPPAGALLTWARRPCRNRPPLASQTALPPESLAHTPRV